MTAAGWELQQAIFARLDLLLAEPVYDHVPQNAPFPYVVVGDATATAWGAGDLDGESHAMSIHIWSRYQGRKEMKQLMAAIITALNGVALSLSGHQLVDLRFVFADEFPDPDGISRHGLVRFRAVTHPV
ncbi:MAG: hypothetical protein Dbin4_02148 [Alphaproteobacteria bacterium]|nr:hypothetical protein [Alphaproteobacteria bacterium]